MNLQRLLFFIFMKLHSVPKIGPDGSRELLTAQIWSLHSRKESKGRKEVGTQKPLQGPTLSGLTSPSQTHHLELPQPHILTQDGESKPSLHAFGGHSRSKQKYPVKTITRSKSKSSDCHLEFVNKHLTGGCILIIMIS